MEAIVETDEELMKRYLEGETISVEELSGRCGLPSSRPGDAGFVRLAFKNKGVQPLLGRGGGLPAFALGHPAGARRQPADRGGRGAAASDDEPFSALCFKIMTDPYVGRLAFFRVYSGVLKSGSYV